MATPSGRAASLNGFRIYDRESCASAIRNGGSFTAVSAGITLLLAFAGMLTDSSDPTLNYLLDPWAIVDALLLAALSFFLFRKSRIAATLLVLYFVVSKVSLWVELEAVKGLPMTILFGWVYILAMRGTFLWHSKYHAMPDASLAIPPLPEVEQFVPDQSEMARTRMPAGEHAIAFTGRNWVCEQCGRSFGKPSGFYGMGCTKAT